MEWIETIYDSCFCRLSQLELINLSSGPKKLFCFLIMTLNIPLSFFEMLLFIFDHEMLVQQFKAGRSRNCICMFFVQRNSYSRAFVPVQMGVGVSTILVQKKGTAYCFTVLLYFKRQQQKTTETKNNDDNINNNYRNEKCTITQIILAA